MDSVAMCNGIDVSALDERRYECVELGNSLQVLLISDPKTEKSSAAMDVHVGHQSDPEELPGLAHFLEHMLFLGTEKYPDENSYKQYLSAHSGRSNASTSQMHTNYYFDVLSDHFEEALDRFAQFFIAPLFTASATEREMHAVNSENAKNLQNDHRRLYQLQKTLSNPAHPFHKFGTGNIETLGNEPKAKAIDVRKALLEFHETYYSASIMKLVIYGKEDLATLGEWAKKLFSQVRNTGRSFPKFGNAVPYDETRLPRQVHVAPVKDLRSISIAWPLPPLYWDFIAKPSKILSHLLGHEGRGSILSYLKAQKWANGLQAGLSRDNEDWSLFSVKVDATDAGIEHVDEVVSAVYQYVRLLQKKAPFPNWIFKETQDIGLIEFRFKSKESPINYTSYLAGVMHRYPPKYIVSGGYLLYGYDAGKVQEILDSFTPQRMRLTVVSKKFEGKTTSIEKWYGTPYTESAIDEETLAKWQSVKGNRDLQLPHKNEFICSDFQIVTPPPSPADAAYESTPELLESDDRFRLWYKPDTQFRKPKLSLSFLIYSPIVSSSPYHAVLTSLFIRYLKDELTECSYDAELAGMEYEISFNARAIELYVGGFSHKLSTLLFEVLHKMMNMTKDAYKFEDAIFERVKDRTKRMYENFFLEEPYQHAVYGSSLLLESSKWSVEDKIQAIQRLTIRDLSMHAQLVFQQVFIEGFFYGNLERSAAPTLMQNVVKEFRFGTARGSFPILPSQAKKSRVVELDDATEYLYQRKEWNADNLNSSICSLYQIQEESMELRARLELFAHIFKEPCFNQLRTQEQLGYLVFSGLMRTEGVEYFRILLQSNVASPALLDQRIELFVASFRDYLTNMALEIWQKQVNAVVKALIEKPKRESEECMRFWREIANETYVFDRRQRVAVFVATLCKNDLLEFFDAYIAVNGSKRSKLSVHLYGAAHAFPEFVSGDTAGKEQQHIAALSSAAVTGLTASMELMTKSQSVSSGNAASLQIIRDIDDFKRRMPLFPERSRDGLTTAANAPARLGGTIGVNSVKTVQSSRMSHQMYRSFRHSVPVTAVHSRLCAFEVFPHGPHITPAFRARILATVEQEASRSTPKVRAMMMNESGAAASSDSEQQQQRRNTSQLDRHHVVEKVQQQHDPLRRGNSSPRGLGAGNSSGAAGTQPTTTTASAANSIAMATATTTITMTATATTNASAYTTTMHGANAGGVSNSDMPSTMKLLSELERSWAMFSASWKVVDLFGGMQIYQQQTAESQTEPLNGMLLSTSSAGLVAFLAGSIGGGGIITAVLLTLLVVFGALWTMTANRVRGQVPSFKNMRVVDGTPSEIFLYLMNVKNYPIWDASVERAEVVHTIDDHSDIVHIVYRPVWMWPMWVTPRDLCLLRYWRRAEDGSYVICLQSAIHPECPPTHGIVRAKCNGGGFTISPRGAGLAQSDEFTSMATNVIHLDPQGWEGKLLQRLNNMHVYLRPQILALTGLQEVMEARKYVCPNVPEEFSAAMASAEDASAAIAAEQQGENGADGAANGGETVLPLQEFPCNVPRSMWAEPDGSAMLVRGPDYLTDRRKIPSAPPAFRLMGVDLFNSSKAIEHIASRPDNIVQKEIKRHEAQGTEMPFTFVINFVVPGNPRINMVLYYQAPNPSILKEGTAFGDLMSDFLDGTDEFRDERFKLIPCIVEGSFIVRQAVGSTPAIIGKKLRQPCYRGDKYFELDVDIGSSAVANRVVGLVSGYTKKLVIDMGFLIEGQRHDELPERLFGSVRLLYIDLSIATKLD